MRGYPPLSKLSVRVRASRFTGFSHNLWSKPARTVVSYRQLSSWSVAQRLPSTIHLLHNLAIAKTRFD
ncbi:hypothetical protein [Chroococcidiopsis sp. CCNUC1]|uniref:hypothetical protein n=1 Tax=Chroococcidiopsis sp. CCNUC1 TaxID=2653189 RepID=UPI002020326B|nr:hypothetical protein [Chroococcidiopsis sp. CCNUC1]URD52072.1 hypothetical protein M5J74_08760 [Chroococcidiopsis sp. CCNUC1]